MNILKLIILSVCVIITIIGIVLAIKLYKGNVNIYQESTSEQELIEGYYDITPYEAHWNIFKCLDPKCIKDKGYECYKWCNNIEETGAAENCRVKCADYADEMFDSIKLQNYTFNYLLPRFSKVTLLKDRDDIVE